jgi:hypothetical protein
MSTSSTVSRKALYLPFIALGVFSAIWAIVWFVMANAAERVADGFMQREAARGRDWVCPARSVSGFPFRIELRCEKPQLIERGAEGLQREATLGALSLHSRILAPGHYIAVLSPPFVAKQGPDQEATLNWQSARASFRGGKEGIGDASFEMTAPVLGIGLGEMRDQLSRAKEFSLHIRRSPGEVAGTDLVFRAVDISVQALDQRMGNPDPLTLEFQATAPGLIFDPARKAQDVLEAWRIGGGKARVVLAKVNKGQAAVELTGTLGLDAERRPEGALQGRARNLEALTSGLARRTGVDIGAMLGRLAGNQGIPMALTLENGRMRFGPFPLMELHPLY